MGFLARERVRRTRGSQSSRLSLNRVRCDITEECGRRSICNPLPLHAVHPYEYVVNRGWEAEVVYVT